MDIQKIVSDKLSKASQTFLEDIVFHGIHSLTNDYNDEFYDEFDAEFKKQAAEILHQIEKDFWEKAVNEAFGE